MSPVGNRKLVAVGAVAVALVAVVLTGRDGPDAKRSKSRPVPATTIQATVPSTVTPTAPVAEVSPHNPDVQPVDCRSILTTEDVDLALDVWDREDGPVSTPGYARGETCRNSVYGDERSFVQFEPGEPADFASAAVFFGGSGTPIDGIGDGAVWFAGIGDEAYAGLLAVRQDTPLGMLHFRLGLGRPELDDASRLAVAVDLARAMLPRFPGVDVEPELISFEDEPVDTATQSLDAALYAGVDSGTWSMGEGLKVLLSWMLDGGPGVVPDELTDPSSTGVIVAANAYLEDEPPDAPQVRALLDRLTPGVEDLEAMTAPAEASAPLLVSLVYVTQDEAENPCDRWAVESPCLRRVALSDDLDPDTYSLYAALEGESAWSIGDVEAAKEALLDSASTYETLGSMPPTVLVLRPSGDTLYASYVPGEDCRVYVGEFLAGTPRNDLKQIFAREIAFCLIAHDFFLQFFANPNPTRWLAYGLANYLSGVVYPSNDLEHVTLPDTLASQELSTTVPDRSWTNWILFEHLHSFIGPTGVTDMIRGFPESGDLVAALAAAPGVPEMYHDLARALSDAEVVDVGSGTVPYAPEAWELNLSGPAKVPMPVTPFGVRRLHIQVPPGKFACVDSFTQGNLRMSWRSGAPGDSGSWSDQLPTSFQGESVLVLTSVEPGAHFTLDVTDISTNPDCEDDQPEYDPGACDLGVVCGPSRFYFQVVPLN